LLVAGCGLRLALPSPGTAPRRDVAARSVRGDPIEVFRCGQEAGGVLVVGGMHGDERGGAALVRELTIRLACTHGGGALTIMPVLNPDGLYVAARANARGVDLNRNLPTHSWVPRPAHGGWPMSEPESRALYDVLVRANPAFVISVHEGTEPLVDWDGPAADAAQGLGACTGLEVRRIGALPGSLGSLVGVDWGRPLVTLELPRAASSLPVETLWATYGHCLLEAVGQPGSGHAAGVERARRGGHARPAWRWCPQACW